MKMLRFFALALCLAAAVALAAEDPQQPQPISNAAFDKLKTLAGAWEGTYVGPEGSFKGTARFKVVSGGSAIMLSMDEGKDDEMITVFHPDGHQAMLATHYCSGQNQPRMKLSGVTDPNKLVFTFVDGTNLAEAKHGYMKRLVITIVDADHHVEEWTSEAKGKSQTAKFDYHRVKS